MGTGDGIVAEGDAIRKDPEGRKKDPKALDIEAHEAYS
jgi:hypothetical protein